MGNGKGNPEYYVAEIEPGKVLYEMDGVDEALAREAFALAVGQAADPDDVRASPDRLTETTMKNIRSEEGARRQERRPSCRRSSRRCCKEQFGLRMQAATQQLTNTSQAAEGAPRHRPRADADPSEEAARARA